MMTSNTTYLGATFVVCLSAAIGCGDDTTASGTGGSGATGGTITSSGGSGGVGGTGGQGGSGTGNGGGGSAPLGEHLTYTKSGDLYVARNDGSEEQMIRPGGAGDVTSPVWSPDGSRIAFIARTDNGSDWGLYVTDPDGGNEQTVLEPTAHPGIGAPAWFPDGERLAYHFNAGGHNDINVVSVDGTNDETIIGAASNDGAPAVSPDGATIVYQSDVALWTANADGTGAQVLVETLPELFTVEPVWAHDGSLIYFSAGDFEADIYQVRPDGTELTQISSASAGEYSPTVSADGSTLAVYHFGTPPGVYTVDLADGAVSLLVEGASEPSYEP